MGTGEHGHVGESMGQAAQFIAQAAQCRRHDLRARIAQHQAVGQIIDVFRSAGEMDEGQRTGERGFVTDFLTQEIFDRLHIVIGGAFDGFDAACGFEVELRDDGIELGQRARAQGR